MPASDARCGIHESHAGLDNGERAFSVHLQYFPHVSAHVQTDATRHARRTAAISNVAANAKWPNGDFEFIAQADDALYIWNIARSRHSRADEVLLGRDVEHLKVVNTTDEFNPSSELL